MRSQHQRDLWFLRIIFYGAFAVGAIFNAWLYSTRMEWSTPRWLTVSALSGVEVSGYLGLLFLLRSMITTWRATIRLQGWPSREVIKSYRLAARPMAMRRYHTVPMVGMAVIAVGLGINLSWRFTAFGLTFIGLYLAHFESLISQPAMMLLLAKSGVEQVGLHSRLKRRAMNLRVVALLDNEGLLDDHKKEDYWMSMVIGADCLRTANPALWHAVVGSLVSRVPLVVLDARTPTPSVVSEAIRLIHGDVLYKTIFIGSPEGGLSVLEQAAPHLRSRDTVVWATEDDVVSIYAYLTSKPGLMPTRAQPAASILRPLATSDGRHVARYATLEGVAKLESASILSDTIEEIATEALLLAVPIAGGGEFDTRKCAGCGKMIPQDAVTCPGCGRVHWFNIVAGVVFGVALIAIAIIYCKSWLWRSLWLAIGVVNGWNWGRDGLHALRKSLRSDVQRV